MKKQLWVLAVVVAGELVFATGIARAGGGPNYEQQPTTAPPSSPGPTNSSGTTSAAAANSAISAANPTPPYRPTGGVLTSGAFKTADNPTVYLLLGGQLYPLTSEAALLAWGYSLGQVQVVSPNRLAAYPVSGELGIPDGTIVKTGNGPAYIVFNNQKNPASPPELLADLGLSLARAVTISAADLASLAEGPPVSLNP